MRARWKRIDKALLLKLKKLKIFKFCAVGTPSPVFVALAQKCRLSHLRLKSRSSSIFEGSLMEILKFEYVGCLGNNFLFLGQKSQKKNLTKIFFADFLKIAIS